MHALRLDNSAVIPAGKHLFPFRTEKLSSPGPMVLGGQPPGRVGRRRFLSESRPRGGLSVVLIGVVRGGAPHEPVVAERIDDAPLAPAVRLVGDREPELAAGRDG